MDYLKHYGSLIARAKSREKPAQYTERHHVIPRCMGGSNSASNLVILTPEEHFVAHQLLVKLHPDHAGLRFAAHFVASMNNKRHGWIRRGVARAARAQAIEQWRDPAHKALISERNTGKRATCQTKDRLSAALKAHFASPTARKKLSDGTKAQFSDPQQRARLSSSVKTLWSDPEYRAKLVGKRRSEEARHRMSEGCLARPVLVCPHCGKEGKGGNMKRYHFEKCFSLNQLLKGAEQCQTR